MRPSSTGASGPSRALFLQNSGAEGPGLLAGLAGDLGLDAVVSDPRDGIPGWRPALAVILGGPESANDEAPHIAAQKAAVLRWAGLGVPVLGVCLGAQIAASALGARVYRGPEEFGFGDVEHWGDPLLGGIPSPFPAFHWHGEGFDLPDGATRLAGSPAYGNQAFRMGSVVGFQFHLEADEGMVRRWGCSDPGAPGLARATAAHMAALFGNVARLAGLARGPRYL
ncbi:MAG: type 1 glutamine amidotransferase [Nitrosopumilus sp.]|nr:type 1 glutamine amidotransferase [Nitrosopumilus sp.]MDA7945291.1 type 1 glutamine amidotransferase [Nitrosopumilus sp.]MDA7955267.1 type 1 glutamine amidotransferase [Nitrosopumilus sp.]MDA7974255.1 type 1 glutamine amidotransferase [Nitrosopumilus sp.]MDA7997061.1 type 1 glutamine amidotransferase [Nitrosopumilus sp.]